MNFCGKGPLFLERVTYIYNIMKCIGILSEIDGSDIKIFHGHTDEPHDLSTESISITDKSHTIHDQLLIVVYVKLMAEMTGMVGIGLKLRLVRLLRSCWYPGFTSRNAFPT